MGGRGGGGGGGGGAVNCSVVIEHYIYDSRIYHLYLLPVLVDRGWQFIADDCGVKCAYNAVGAKIFIRISNLTYIRLVTKMGQLV